MKKILSTVLITAGALIMSGCVETIQVPTFSANEAQEILTYETGTVTAVKGVVIRDNGGGTLLGAVTGAVFGSMMGKGKGKTLATLTGGLAGAYAGSQIGSANAQELSVHLDNGQDVVVIAKGVRFMPGSRVKILKHGNKIVSVNAINS